MHTTTTFNISIHTTEAFALPNNLNKQQETYADMTNRPARIAEQSICHTHRHLL